MKTNTPRQWLAPSPKNGTRLARPLQVIANLMHVNGLGLLPKLSPSAFNAELGTGTVTSYQIVTISGQNLKVEITPDISPVVWAYSEEAMHDPAKELTEGYLA